MKNTIIFKVFLGQNMLVLTLFPNPLKTLDETFVGSVENDHEYKLHPGTDGEMMGLSQNPRNYVLRTRLDYCAKRSFHPCCTSNSVVRAAAAVCCVR